MRIDGCFDSHVHWAATGEFARRLRLDGLSSADLVTSLDPLPHHHRGDWLLGFGWDDAAWPAAPHRRVLDEWRPGVPIAFTKIDGHARWLSTEALRRAGLLGPHRDLPAGARVERDADGQPTGVISERATDLVDAVLPPPDAYALRRDLLAAVRTFNAAGFTHVRDLTCDEAQWHEAVRLDESGLLTLAVEEYFWVRDAAAVTPMIDLALRARKHRTPNLRACGLKFFFDGALGSEGASISRCYHGRDHRGLELWTVEELTDAVTRTWRAGLAVAVHAIGDEAADKVTDVAARVNAAGTRGRLHVEHAQLLRPATIARMKTLDVRCHLQPAHWLSDRAWLTDKLGDLARLAFPWRALQESDVPFSFGSDSPIDPPGVARAIRALEESAAHGVPRLLGRPERHFAYPGPAWTPDTFSIFEHLAPRHVVFRGEHVV